MEFLFFFVTITIRTILISENRCAITEMACVGQVDWILFRIWFAHSFVVISGAYLVSVRKLIMMIFRMFMNQWMRSNDLGRAGWFKIFFCLRLIHSSMFYEQFVIELLMFSRKQMEEWLTNQKWHIVNSMHQPLTPCSGFSVCFLSFYWIISMMITRFFEYQWWRQLPFHRRHQSISPLHRICISTYCMLYGFPQICRSVKKKGTIALQRLVFLFTLFHPGTARSYCLSAVLCGYGINGNATANTFIFRSTEHLYFVFDCSWNALWNYTVTRAYFEFNGTTS